MTATAEQATGIRVTYQPVVVRERQKEVGVMARCKRCKAAKRLTAVATRTFQRTDRWGHDVYSRSVVYPPAECCVSRVIGGTTVEMYEIRGTVTDQPCDARCTNAKGHTCECSCGGKNHGMGN